MLLELGIPERDIEHWHERGALGTSSHVPLSTFPVHALHPKSLRCRFAGLTLGT
jgi:hypothetical protein